VGNPIKKFPGDNNIQLTISNKKKRQLKITATRPSESNKLFPAEIHIEPNELIVKLIVLFSG